MQTVSFGFIGLLALPILPIRGRFLFAKGMITKHFLANFGIHQRCISETSPARVDYPLNKGFSSHDTE
jgi:hypothetical protein